MAEPRRRPRAAVSAALVLSVLGLLVSAYLTYTHYTEAPLLACPETSFVNCASVTTSAQSRLLGLVPVALAGLLYFAGMTVLTLPHLYGSRGPWPARLRVAGAASGAAMVVYLVFVEFHQLHALCLYCTAVHVITVALFAVVVYGEALATPVTSRRVTPPRARR